VMSLHEHMTTCKNAVAKRNLQNCEYLANASRSDAGLQSLVMLPHEAGARRGKCVTK
jgi:hypothetical protein